MRPTYDVVEKMMIGRILSTSVVLSTLSPRMRVVDLKNFQNQIADVYDTKTNSSVAVIYKDENRIVISSTGLYGRYREDELVDIGYGVTICVATKEHLFDFLIRNKLFSPDKIPELQRLVIANA